MSATKKQIVVIAALLVAGCLAVFGTLYLTYSRVRFPVVEGVQGRYFIPFLPLLAVLGGLILEKLGVKVDVTKKTGFKISASLAVLVTVSLTFAAAKYYLITWG